MRMGSNEGGRKKGKSERKRERKRKKERKKERKQGRRVADGWAGLLMQEPIAIQKCDGRTDQPTRQSVE